MIDEQAYFTVSVFTKAPGTFVKKEDLTDAFFMQLGQQVGQMHRLTKDFHPRHKRQEFYEDEYIDLGRKYLPLEKQFIVDKTIALINKIKAYDRGVDSYGLIHTDLHFGNMFYDGTSITFFDFDDASYKHFISDIAIIIFYLYGLTPLTDSEIEEKTANLLKWFFKGYEKENTLDKVWFTRLNDFLKLRELVLYLVIYAAGEDMLKSPFGTFYIKKFEERIMTDQAFFDINRVLNLWNS
jgi:Ser/Thr protein kinase RdoA (MazF antagonist)